MWDKQKKTFFCVGYCKYWFWQRDCVKFEPDLHPFLKFPQLYYLLNLLLKFTQSIYSSSFIKSEEIFIRKFGKVVMKKGHVISVRLFLFSTRAKKVRKNNVCSMTWLCSNNTSRLLHIVITQLWKRASSTWAKLSKSNRHTEQTNVTTFFTDDGGWRLMVLELVVRRRI